MPTCQRVAAETEFARCLSPVVTPVAGPFQREEAIRVVEDKEEWSELSSALGEALLDVERTFLDIVERQATPLAATPLSAGGPPVKAYLDAWSRLNGAHRVLARFLVRQGTPLHRMELRCGQCSQELR
jgi:hypothetical protein